MNINQKRYHILPNSASLWIYKCIMYFGKINLRTSTEYAYLKKNPWTIKHTLWIRRYLNDWSARNTFTTCSGNSCGLSSTINPADETSGLLALRWLDMAVFEDEPDDVDDFRDNWQMFSSERFNEVSLKESKIQLTMCISFHDNLQRGKCIKGLFWPPLEPKIEDCISPISSYWFIRRKAQV